MGKGVDGISKKVIGIADCTKERVKVLYDLTKIKIEIRNKEAELDDCFERLGRVYFVHIKNKADNEKKIDALAAKAEKLSSEIIQLKEQLAKAQNKKICTHCASLLDIDAPYCEYCGQKIVAEAKK